MPLSKPQAAYAPARALGEMDRPEKITAAELHERYLEAVFRYVLRRVLLVEEAEDITAAVFASATAALPRFRRECPPYLWLLSIARRQIARARRQQAIRRETLASELADEAPDAQALWEALAAVEGPEVTVIRAETRRVLHGLIAQLNEDQREALMLQYVERLSVAEIAHVMGRSPGSVRGLLERAKAALLRLGREYFLEDV
jgi:RNA polymerase sigma-70 factor (ECF subfamily)